MPNTWVAVDAGIDPVSWARLLRRAYDRAATERLAGGRSAPDIVRPVISASWQRSERARVDIEWRAPIMLEPEEVARSLRQHPVAGLLPIIKSILVQVAEYAHQAVVVADPEGHVLWVSGYPETCEAAQRINLVAGALWSEEVCGTNAIGTAIVLNHPLQVFSAEHFKPMLHGWSCSAAPIHDPEGEALLGVVALAGSFKRAHPHGFSLVVATAQIAEAHLQHDASERDERLKVEYLEHVLSGCGEASAVVNRLGRVLLSTPPGWLGSRLRLSPEGVPTAFVTEEVTVERMRRGEGFLVMRNSADRAGGQRPVLRIEALGRERATGVLGRRSFEFTPRHSEILVILAQHPHGLSEDDLATALYGSSIKNVTIRAEISRLRRLLGSVIMTRPYRLVADVRADFLELLSLLEQGAGPAAGATHPDKLLPTSTAPAVVETRMRIEQALTRSCPAAGGEAVDGVGAPAKRDGSQARSVKVSGRF